jgi:hypothetical protein
MPRLWTPDPLDETSREEMARVAQKASEDEARAHVEALTLAKVWVWAQGEARARGKSLPSGLALRITSEAEQWIVGKN